MSSEDIMDRISFHYRLGLLEEEPKEVKQAVKETPEEDSDITREPGTQSCKGLNGFRKAAPASKGKLPQRAMTSPNFRTKTSRARTISEKAEENDMVIHYFSGLTFMF